MRFLLILCLVSSVANADWLCESQSSVRRGNAYYICGLGDAANESGARSNALEAAMKEYQTICEASSECRGHKVDVEPMRTTCANAGPGYHCSRLVVFTLGAEIVPSRISDRTLMRPAVNFPVTITPINRLRVGMAKAQLLELFGTPTTVEHNPYTGALQMFFRGGMCTINNVSCYVIVDKGVVVSWEEVRPELTEDVE